MDTVYFEADVMPPRDGPYQYKCSKCGKTVVAYLRAFVIDVKPQANAVRAMPFPAERPAS
jgi:hypothetical protein